MTKILPISNDLQPALKKLQQQKNAISLKPIKNYIQYLKEYGLKPIK